MDYFWLELGGAGERGRACLSLQILQNGEWIQSRPAPPAGVRRILWATPSAAGPRSLLFASGSQILGIVASGSWYFWDVNLSFGMIGGFTLASLGTLGQFGKTGEHNKGNFKGQARIFTDF